MSLTFVSRQDAVAYMPQDAKRVHVREEDGTIRWKPLSDVQETDAICFKNGKPMTMKSHPGRPTNHRALSVAPVGLSVGMGQPVAPEITRNNDRKKKSVATIAFEDHVRSSGSQVLVDVLRLGRFAREDQGGSA